MQVLNHQGSGVPYTLHWDGGALLFVSDAAGNVVDFKVGTDGETAPNTTSGVTVYDRDTAGVMLMTSNASGHSALEPLDSSDLSGPSYPETSGYQPSSKGLFDTNRADGYNFGGFRINGVRAFDAALGSWTTPDAYAGDVHDPASQQRYMWNRNNPYEYSDPSGYFPDAVAASGAEWWGDTASSSTVAVAHPYDGPKEMWGDANNAVVLAFGHEESKGSFNNKTNIELVANYLDKRRYEVGNPTQLTNGAYQVNATNPVTGSTAKITMNGRQADIRVSYFGQTLPGFSTRYQWFGRGDLQYQYYGWDAHKWTGASIKWH